MPPTSVQAVHTPAGGVPSTLANLPAGTLITGTVTGRDAAGQTLLRTDAGTLSIQVAGSFPVAPLEEVVAEERSGVLA